EMVVSGEDFPRCPPWPPRGRLVRLVGPARLFGYLFGFPDPTLSAFIWRCSIAVRSGAIRANDTVWLRAHTGRRIHVEGDIVRASSPHRGPYQALRLERKPGTLDPGALRSGERIFLRAHTGHHLEVLRQDAMARSERYGAQQAFVITKPTGSY
ncbi:unnamed protein product, partial [Prorocentrum cordatum]